MTGNSSSLAAKPSSTIVKWRAHALKAIRHFPNQGTCDGGRKNIFNVRNSQSLALQPDSNFWELINMINNIKMKP